ncbi:ABC transporter ATP-binding protein [Methanolapillus millepedarum]|uniref:Vitamin B12 import ATP-binding protein BtuD n=1 Tax=Methanolapillus millepedarum TaxID=3028296 RepID=A0AA97A3D5_9EURY|nr:Vitamin B12 import ATP-binding protein BtuD [Methanosarcinaceae archaeon Ac7]
MTKTATTATTATAISAINGNILELNGVSKHFDNFTLDVSFSLPKGFIMGFIGQNGAGKTTTMKTILNMLKNDGGTISVFGEDNRLHEPEIKNRIGVVMDRPFYVEEWTVADVGKAVRVFYTNWDDDKYKTTISQFDLDSKKKVKDLSRGMKMKLMIAVALSHDADLLLLDEPTSGLDAVARNELMDILLDFMTEDKSILFSTHITSDLEKIADYITFIRDGKIVYSDTKDELLEKYGLVKGGLNILSEEQKRQIIGYKEHGFGFDGLADKEIMKLLPTTVVTEPSTLDEIVIRFNMKDSQREMKYQMIQKEAKNE